MELAVLGALVHGAQAVLHDHQRDLVAVVDRLEVVAQALGVDRPAPVARLEVGVGHAAKEVAGTLLHLGVNRDSVGLIVAETVEVNSAGLENLGIALGETPHVVSVHALLLP